MIKFAIFDLDGTLVDSMTYWSETPKKYLNKLGFECTDEMVVKFLSISLPESAKYIKEYFKLDLTEEEIMKGINDVMEENYLNYVKLKPYILILLKELNKLGIKMGIASATDVYLIEKAIKKLGISEYFSSIVSSTDVGKSKQFTDVYDICKKPFNVENNETIIFEDLPYGIISCSKAGYHTVGIYDEPSKMHQEKIKANAELYYLNLNQEAVDEIVEFCKK